MHLLLTSITKRICAAQSSLRFLLICAVWLLITAGLRPLKLPDEGRYVGVAWEMLNGGNLLVPTLDGLPFFHKPPLFYWLTYAGFELFGVNQWAARLASTASATLAMIGAFLFIRKYSDTPTANLATVVLVTQPFFFAAAQFANLDMLVASMITLTILAGADAILCLERGKPYKASLVASYLFAALGVLAKGLIGLVLPGAILLGWIVIRGKFRLIPRLFPLVAILLFVIVAAPWFIQMQLHYDDFLNYFFVHHHFQRFAASGFNNPQPFWFYVPVLLLLTIPWSFWLLGSWRKTHSGALEKSDIRSLMIIWLVVTIGFFSVPTSKLVGYILPALPPFAFLIGEAAVSRLRTSGKASTGAWIGLSVVAGSVVCLSVIIGVARNDLARLDALPINKEALFKPNDQLVMLGGYRYDLPYYLDYKRPVWVVEDWQNPDIPKRDNWRKELYDAGEFDKERMRERLITPQQFLARLCASAQERFWIWAADDDATRYPFLSAANKVSGNKGESMWLVTGNPDGPTGFCGSKAGQTAFP